MCCALSWLSSGLQQRDKGFVEQPCSCQSDSSSCDVDTELIQSKPQLFLLGTNPEIHCGTAKVEEEDDDEEKDEEREKKITCCSSGEKECFG